ncbi:MAG: hypothetical protein DI533_19545 [Cereibacter sphaeroides]|uniref:Uncharacterized protein n=1 Tax=Cereibacter sphaeroides TaxID=1063 RepID=A0A2W5RXZ7_CERSP|nr:MAG: hypothetical protein DI533_19545 [Cereibacter sphaeroides]
MLRILMLFTVLMAGWSVSTPVVAQANRAVSVCANTALKDFLILRRVVDQRDLSDKRGRVFARQVEMDMRDGGRTVRITCTYEIKTGRVRLERGRPGGPVLVPPGQADPRAARNACVRAVKDQRLVYDRVLKETDMRNSRGQIVGRAVLIGAYIQGKPRQIVCEYDYARRRPILQIRR